MKKVLMLVFISLVAICFEAEAMSPNWYIIIHVNYGQRGKNCTGFGVCGIWIDAGEGDPPKDRVAGIPGKIENLNGKISITHDVSNIDKTTMKNQFASKKFVVDEDFKIPDDIVKQLKLAAGSNIIKKGTYNFKQVGSSLTIFFN